MGDYTLSYHVSQYNWYSDTVKVHLAEDGKFYKINDDGSMETEPYVVQVRMKTEEEQIGDTILSANEITFDVNTYTHNDIPSDDIFTEGSQFNVFIEEQDAVTGETRQLAKGTSVINETGMSTITVYPNSASETPAETIDIKAYNNYYIRFNTTKADGSVDTKWISDPYTYQGSGREIVQRINDGNFTLNNECLLFAWKTTDPQKTVRTESDNSITFKPIKSTTEFKDKANYIIVARNTFDGGLYALAYDENGGHQVKLFDAEEIAGITNIKDLQYTVAETDNIANYVLQANKVKWAEGSTSLQFKTGLKNSSGKTIAIKLGQSSTILDPLFDGSAGTLSVYQEGDYNFSIWKGRYARLEYMPELFGYSGFDVQGYYTGTHGTYPTVFLDCGYPSSPLISVYAFDSMKNNAPGSTNEQAPFQGIFDTYYTHYTEVQNSNGNRGFSGVMVPGTATSNNNYYQANIPAEYLTPEYFRSFSAYYDPSTPVFTNFMILSDTVEEEVIPEVTNEYTLVKTAGDFIQTFVNNQADTYAADMVLVWTDETGNEWALNPKGLVKLKSEVISGDYRKINVGAENEVIPNNNSGTSAKFDFQLTDVEGTMDKVFAGQYALRKSRQNDSETKEYLTLSNSVGATAWTKADDASHGSGLVYVLKPTSPIRSESDFDTPETYTLSVIRDGETYYLGVEEIDGKQQMVVKDDPEDAIAFRVYTDNLRRYYSSAYGTDLYRYYRVTSIEDINALDELLIVYNDGTTRYLVSTAYTENGSYGSSYYGSYIPGAVQVLPEYSTVDSRDSEFPENAAYKYRFNTDEYAKKPFAYLDLKTLP